MRTKNIKKITLTAVFTALVAVATMVITIPLSSSGGYVNFGDTIIFVAAALLGPLGGFVSGAIGSSIADLVFAPKWIPITFIVKGLEGFICGIIISALIKKCAKEVISYTIAMISGAIIMVVGYFFGGWLLEGLTAGSFKTGLVVAIYDIPFNLIQGGVSVIVGALITFALLKIKYIKDFLKNVYAKEDKPISIKENKSDT